MLEYKFDTQLLIEGENLDEDKINEYFIKNFKGGFIKNISKKCKTCYYSKECI